MPVRAPPSRLTALGLACLGVFAAPMAAPAAAQPGPADQDVVEQIVLHPLFEAAFACSEHWVGQLAMLGDALGTDCMVIGPVETDNGGFFMSPYRGDGSANSDWFSFGARVLAPFDGRVVHVAEQPENAEPGSPSAPPASVIVFRREDGLMAIYAHITEPLVARGDRVDAGQPVAQVGNNGFSRAPHIHAGAWRGRQALQIIWDLQAYAGQMRAGEEG